MNSRVGNISLPQKKPNELGKKPYSDKLSRLIDEVIIYTNSLHWLLRFLYIVYFVYLLNYETIYSRYMWLFSLVEIFCSGRGVQQQLPLS